MSTMLCYSWNYKQSHVSVCSQTRVEGRLRSRAEQFFCFVVFLQSKRSCRRSEGITLVWKEQKKNIFFESGYMHLVMHHLLNEMWYCYFIRKKNNPKHSTALACVCLTWNKQWFSPLSQVDYYQILLLRKRKNQQIPAYRLGFFFMHHIPQKRKQQTCWWFHSFVFLSRC